MCISNFPLMKQTSVSEGEVYISNNKNLQTKCVEVYPVNEDETVQQHLFAL